ncbi:MAG: TetR/AcrR family transcriptional regulator [Solirubrobacterales bacterium]|nr:TetR/AcrR family transcriptional regulator [Solirubrobacterales bacterium]
MARPRLHTVDDLLDVAEELVTTADPAGLTLRALAAKSGASNGTIYHAFRSKEELLARLWLRATARLGDLMLEAVNSAGDGEDRGERAVVAVALAPARLVREHPASAQLFLGQRSDQLFNGADLAPELLEEIADQHKRFIGALAMLANAVWDRADGIAVEAIATCVVDIPGGLLRRRLLEGRGVDTATECRIKAAVAAVLAIPLDPPRKKKQGDRRDRQPDTT